MFCDDWNPWINLAISVMKYETDFTILGLIHEEIKE
jgi:hypothetical protein